VTSDNLKTRPATLLRTIARDTHFWIPLVVLIAGLLLLRELH
jgi:hypothetical protein